MFLDALRNPKRSTRNRNNSTRRSEPARRETNRDYGNSYDPELEGTYDYESEPYEGEVLGSPYYPSERQSEPEPEPAKVQQPAAPTAPAAQKKRPAATRAPIGKVAEAREASEPKGSYPYKKDEGGVLVSMEDRYNKLLKKGFGAAVNGIMGDIFIVLYHYRTADGSTHYTTAERVLHSFYEKWWDGDPYYNKDKNFDIVKFIGDLKRADRTAFRMWPEEEGRQDRRKTALTGEDAEMVLKLHDKILDDVVERVEEWLKAHPTTSAASMKPKQPETGFGFPERELQPKSEEKPTDNEVLKQVSDLAALMSQFIATQQAQAAQQSNSASDAQADPVVPEADSASTDSAPADADSSQNSTPAPVADLASNDSAASAAPPAPASANSTGAPANRTLPERLNASASRANTEAVITQLTGRNAK